MKCFPVRLIRNFSVTNKNFMMKFLNVAEKNDVAKTISALLSNGTARRREGYSVFNKIYEFETNVRGVKSKMIMTSVSGHLLQLDFVTPYKRNWKGCTPDQLFHAPVCKSCTHQFLPIKKTIEREIKLCDGLIIWTDCDREGENIGFEIIDVCRSVNKNIVVFRAIFSEITMKAANRALNNLSEPNKRLSDAVNIRLELDLRTGAAITRLQTLRLQNTFPEKISGKIISYGSCQIPTLGFVAERYKEIEAFIPEKFWKIKVLHTIGNLSVEFNWNRNRLFEKEACEDFLMLCLSTPEAKVEKVTKKPKVKQRPISMDTVTLEKLGSRKLKLSAKEIMNIAEKLYTKGIISYPRTETTEFSNEIDLKCLVNQHVEHSIWGDFAKKVMDWNPNPRNGNKSDNAHPPIHPLKMMTDLSGNEARVYELIVRHFLACVSRDAIGFETIVNINIAGEKFSAAGLEILERNYLEVYVYENWNAKEMHAYTEGEKFYPTDISMHEGATTAPPLLTEADLIALMEKNGIGTDATHAEHINTIKERGYIGEADGGYLVPGVIGMGLYESYEAMDLTLSKPKLRAKFEEDLKKICLGEKDPTSVLRENIQIYEEAYKIIVERIMVMDEKFALRINGTNDVANNSKKTPKSSLHCSVCFGSGMELKHSKNRDKIFIKCTNTPICNNIIWLPDELKEISVKDEKCKQCNRSNLLKMKLPRYSRSVFNAPNGWYKTCLNCDKKLCEVFNINVGQAKADQRTINTTNVIDTSNLLSDNDGLDRIMLELPIVENSMSREPKYDSVPTLGCPVDGKTKRVRKEPNETPSIEQRNKKISVECNCKRLASSFTVRKEGINKGRQFYTCSNLKKPCGFFKWCDGGLQDVQQQNSQNLNRVNQTKRKCGLCRKEGHTKLKCPEKNKFNQD